MTTKKEILGGLRVPGWEQLTDAARAAVIAELAELPEDVGPKPARETAPACQRINEVIDALDRAATREGVTDDDRAVICGWQGIRHARTIAMFLDLATMGADFREAISKAVAAKLIGSKCIECDVAIADGDRYERTTVIGADGAATLRAVHRECLALRMLGHQYGVCSCTALAGQPTTRAAALELARRMTDPGRSRGGAS